MKQYDVAIIGAGTAGLSARKEVVKVTDNYVVIDGGVLGTTCARVGCMPSKVLIQVAEDWHRRLSLAEQGISGVENLKLDRVEVMKHVRKLRDRFVRGVLLDMENWKDKLIPKYAQFVDANTLDLGDEKIRAKKIIIATGSSPITPGPWREYQKYFMDTNQFFEQKTLPQKVALIGLGVIGVELGQALARLGVEVIGIAKGESLAGIADPEIRNYFRHKLCEDMELHFDGVESFSEENGKLVVRSNQKSWAVDQAIIAVGRSPNTKNLGLENLKLTLNEFGVPHFDSRTGQVEDLPVYISGDVNNFRPILHEAADEGRIVGYNSVHDKPLEVKRYVPLSIVFSEPSITHVGLNVDQLRDNKVDYVVGKVSFEGQGRSIIKLKEKGLLHIYADKNSGELLGAEMFGPDAEHIGHLLAWMIQLKQTVFDILKMPFYHPVVEEGLRTALRNAAKQI